MKAEARAPRRVLAGNEKGQGAARQHRPLKVDKSQDTTQAPGFLTLPAGQRPYCWKKRTVAESGAQDAFPWSSSETEIGCGEEGERRPSARHVQGGAQRAAICMRGQGVPIDHRTVRAPYNRSGEGCGRAVPWRCRVSSLCAPQKQLRCARQLPSPSMLYNAGCECADRCVSCDLRQRDERKYDFQQSHAITLYQGPKGLCPEPLARPRAVSTAF